MTSALTDKLSVKRIREALAQAKTSAETLVARRGELTAAMTDETLGELLEIYEQLNAALALAGSWTDARFSIAQTDEHAAALSGEVSAFATNLVETILFFSLTLKTFPAARLEQAAKALPRYKQFLREIALGIPHTLSEAEERVLLITGEYGDGAHDTIYDLLTTSFRYDVTIEGNKLHLTRSELQQYFSHPERSVRKAAMDAMKPPYEAHKDVLAELYRVIVGGYRAETTKLRNFPSPIAARHHANTIPPEAYEALVRVAKKRVRLFQDYVQLKARILGLDEFTRYDFLAPAPGLPDDIEYENALTRVLTSFDSFAPWFGDAARTVIDAGHLDAFPRDGKRSGACCYGVAPGQTPIVLTNYTKRWNDVSTLAHELGHAVHDVVANKCSPLTYSPPLVLAESASTLGEYLLFLDALREATPQAAIALLCEKLDDALLTIINQVRITRFEEQAFALLEQNAPASELDALWGRLAQEDFPDVDFPDSNLLWRSIPHIHHTPFYCYSYAFGLLLVCALVRRRSEPGFPDAVKAILAAGGDAMPVELLQAHGLDLTADQVWEDGFATLAELVTELRERVAQ